MLKIIQFNVNLLFNNLSSVFPSQIFFIRNERANSSITINASFSELSIWLSCSFYSLLIWLQKLKLQMKWITITNFLLLFIFYLWEILWTKISFSHLFIYDMNMCVERNKKRKHIIQYLLLKFPTFIVWIDTHKHRVHMCLRNQV